MSKPSNIRTFEIDLSRGILKADGAEDHARMLEALALLKSSQNTTAANSYTPQELPKAKSKEGLKMLELIDKFFIIKSHSKPATVVSYKNTAKETAEFLGNPFIQDIQISDITRFQEYLSKKNGPRTVDNKMAVLRTLFNFAKTQGYVFFDNPAKDRKTLSEKDKAKFGYEIFEDSEIRKIYKSEFMYKAKEEDKDYYYTLMIALYTGARIGEITALTKKDFKISEEGFNFISIPDSKTKAGIREIPIPKKLLDHGLAEFISGKDKIFKYKMRLGKGSGNAVGKKFKRHLEEVGIDRDKLVFHSIRKFLNDFMANNGMPLEPRCQFMGHEIDNTNTMIYKNKFPMQIIVNHMSEGIEKLHYLSGIYSLKL